MCEVLTKLSLYAEIVWQAVSTVPNIIICLLHNTHKLTYTY